MGGVASTGLSAASLGCSAAMCACNIMSCCCRMGGTGAWNPRHAKFGYLLLLFVATVLALVMRYWGGGLKIDLPGWEYNCEDAGAYCQGDAAVYRISFVSTVFFAFMMVGAKMSEQFHAGMWGPKIVVYLLMLVGCFFLPNYIFDNSGYAWVARVASALFLVLQILMLIDFAYKWNESWVEKAYADSLTDYDGPSDKKWLAYILAASGGMYLFCLVAIILMFVYYTTDGCSLNGFLTSVTLICVVAITGLSLFREQLVGQAGAILPSAVVAVYITYLVWSAMNSSSDAHCNPTAGKNDAANIAMGLLVAAASLVWTSYSASVNAGALFGGGDENEKAAGTMGGGGGKYAAESAELRENDGAAGASAAERGEAAGAEDPDAGAKGRGEARSAGVTDAAGNPVSDAAAGVGQPYWFFHLIMMTASLYMAMLLTNWGAEEEAVEAAGPQANAEIGEASMWVKVVSQWLTVGLYTWTLVAPRCMPGRDFA